MLIPSLKIPPACLALFFFSLPLFGQQPGVEGTSIIGPIADGSPAAPAGKPQPLDFQIRHALTKSIPVSRPSQVLGSPATEDVVTATMQVVDDPGLPDPPLTAISAGDPALQLRIEEVERKFPETRVVLLSATVYRHAYTELRLVGRNGGEVLAVSNLDFNHFSGFGSYQVKEPDGSVVSYALLMGLGNEGAGKNFEPEEKRTKRLDALRRLAPQSERPDFAVLEGDADEDTLKILRGLHDLYRVEGERMATACLKREQAEKDRLDHLRKNPPAPKDVTLRFWKRDEAQQKGDAR